MHPQLRERWAISFTSVELVGFRRNVTMRIFGNQTWYVRLTPTSIRGIDAVRLELSLLSALWKLGANVPCIVSSAADEQLEVISSLQGACSAVVFEASPGTQLQGSRLLAEPAACARWGRACASVHRALTRIDDIGFPGMEERHLATLPMRDSDPDVRREVSAAARGLRALPSAERQLVHGDLHRRNAIEYGESITFLDWEDACVGWPLQDAASAACHLADGDLPNRVLTAATFLSSFLRGYHEVAALSPTWREDLGALLRWREVETYAYIRDGVVRGVKGWDRSLREAREIVCRPAELGVGAAVFAVSL